MRTLLPCRGPWLVGLALWLANLSPLVADTAAAAKLDTKAAPAEARMRKDLTFLAGEECEGRGVNTKGINLAADYIAAAFKAAGLKPAPGAKDYFQPFTMSAGRAKLGKANTLTVKGPKGEATELKYAKEFMPVGLAGSGKVTAPLVFVGYGISAPETAKYDDYKGTDVAGKIVVLLRRTPRPGDKDKPFDGERNDQHASLMAKMTQADLHKAAAVLFVNDAYTARTRDDLMDFQYTATAPSAAKLPAAHIHRDLLDRMLKVSRQTSLADVEKEIDKTDKPSSGPLTGWTATVETAIVRERVAVKNVVGVLEGAGPLAKETVVIGAHYDHLGYGGRGSGSLDRSGKEAIHFGADDNGSGTTALLELARRFGARERRQGRRLVFIAFTGEESGLIGSAHYAKQPLLPMADTVAMINLDMVGRLRPDKESKKDKLIVYGTGTAKTFDSLIDKLNQKYDFKLQKVAGGTGPSDHTSFYLQKVPVFFFFTGNHPEYHKPTDKVDLINFAGMRKIVELVTDLAGDLAKGPKPEYVLIRTTMDSGGRFAIPRLGFMPGNYDEDENKGVLVEAVSKDGPAEKAGIKEGDFIVEVAGKPVRNMTGYMAAMKGQKKGQEFELVVQRKGKKLTLKVTPQ